MSENRDLQDLAEEAGRKAWAKKQEMLQETLIRAVAEGWPRFYFWIEQTDPFQRLVLGVSAITMHCGPVAPEGVEHEVYDVAELEEKIDRMRGDV